MEIVIVGLVLGFLFAVAQGFKAVGKVYRGRRDRWHKKNPKAPRFVSAFAALGDLAAMLRYGPKHFWYGARAGWQMGWQKAKDRTHQYTPPDEEKEPEEEPDSINEWFDDLDDEADRRREQAQGPSNNDDPDDDEKPWARGNYRNDDAGNTNSSEDSMKTPEINKIDDLVKACQDAVNDALAEEKDAAERKARARQKVAWVTSLVEQLTAKKFPKDQVAIAASLKAPALEFEKSANQAVAAAANALTAAKAALTMAKQHMGLVGVAAGDPYN